MTLFEWLNRLMEAPQGPNTPFASPTLILFDTVRVAVVLGLGMVVFATVPYAAFRYTTDWRVRTALGGLGLFLISAMGTEFEHIGDYVHWRWVINAVGVLLAASGMWGMLRAGRLSQ